jgi:hypothetical protein
MLVRRILFNGYLRMYPGDFCKMSQNKMTGSPTPRPFSAGPRLQQSYACSSPCRLHLHRRVSAGPRRITRWPPSRYPLGLRRRVGQALSQGQRRSRAHLGSGRQLLHVRWHRSFAGAAGRRSRRRTLALEVARMLVVFLRRPGNQAQFSVSLGKQSLERNPLRELRVWMAEHLTADLSIPAWRGVWR